MRSKKTRKFLTAASALAGAILGSAAQSAPQSGEVATGTQFFYDERQAGDFVIAPNPIADYNQDTMSEHQSHVSHASHHSHASHTSHHSHASHHSSAP
jgi:hypothetical protein